VKNILASIGSLDPGRSAEGGEEAEGIITNSQLAEESKMPLFMAVAFFTPLMLTLYSIFAHVATPLAFAELLGAQVAMLDIAFYFCSAERERL
jgi:hypothetical protein